jgi:dihydroorotase
MQLERQGRSQDRVTLARPDDWHVHFRDGAMLRAVVPFTARIFGRAIVMPNLTPPVTTVERAIAYREEILRAVPEGSRFQPLMTCYLTDDAEPEEIARGFAEGVFAAVKLYPAHATTNSAAGVTDVRRLYPTLERMQAIGMPLLVHGEVTHAEVDIFDREAVFVERVLAPLADDFPGLKIVFEHITTEDAVAFVRETKGRIGATITAHHLIINRNAIFTGGIRPHMYCLPVAKRERHRIALRRAATSGDPQFFLGTDTAPHSVADKESACGCAGCFTAPTAIELYAQVFDEENVLDRLEAFASLNGPAFYGLPVNKDSITLERSGVDIPGPIPVEGPAGSVLPFRAGEGLAWRVLETVDAG